MCRWLAYSGDPVLLDELLYKPKYSLIVQSLHSLFHSTDVSTLRHQYPDNPVLHNLSDQARLVVSEPLGDLKGAWREVPEGTCVVISWGRDELRPFAPRPEPAPGRAGVTATRT